jgi:hypothetical protein
MYGPLTVGVKESVRVTGDAAVPLGAPAHKVFDEVLTGVMTEQVTDQVAVRHLVARALQVRDMSLLARMTNGPAL